MKDDTMQQEQEAQQWENSPKDYDDKRKEIRMLIDSSNISLLLRSFYIHDV